MDTDWEALITAAKAELHPRRVSEFIEAGGVAAAIQTLRGNIYTGICIDSACSLGMCAERNAAAHMLTCGESAIAKIVCINWNRDFLPPCGAYREFLKELAPENGKLLFLLSENRIVTLRELLLEWWGISGEKESRHSDG